MENDHEILLGLRHGDQEAYKQLFKLHYKSLCYVIQTILKDYNEPPHDIAIETFLTLWEKRIEFSSLENVKEFLFGTATNKCKMYFRAEQKKRKKLAEINQLTDNFDNPLVEPFDKRKALNAIVDSLDSLSPQSRRVFTLHYISGWRLGKIAHFLNVNIGTVKKHNFRAVQKIRNKAKRAGVY